MGSAPRLEKVMPWDKYRPPADQGQGQLRWKLLIPGWGGDLTDEELAFIVAHLQRDSALRLWWGMKGSWKRIPEEAVKRVAMEGSEDNQALNRSLAQPRRQSLAAA